MKSVRSLGRSPVSLPLAADDIVELHAARMLLLVHHCGSNNRIDGLTKLAKIDFFVRYPGFLCRVAKTLGKDVPLLGEQVESNMVRYHYGPWDKRYYQVLAFLESRMLISVEKEGRTYSFMLTSLGQDKARVLSKQEPFELLVSHMKAAKKVLGRKSGPQLKNLVYEGFDSEVKQRKLGEIIR